MADQSFGEASSSSQAEYENAESTIEINIKTLDSKMFPLQVDKNTPILMLKEKIANVVGTPVGQQRLIFRGKVLKDDELLSAHHVEDGHTLHLVARQPVQTENQLGQNSAGTVGNADDRGSDPAAGVTRNRVGVVEQIAHNVVLGPFNIGDQNEIVMPDLSRIIGSVLSSLGIGTPATTAGVGSSPSTNQPGSSSQGSQTETNGVHVASGRPSAENQLPFSPNLFPFQSFNQSQPFHMVTPDSLTTMYTYIARLEQAFSLNGYQLSAPSSGEDSRMSDVPSSGISVLPTPELLGALMERAQRMLSGQAATALSRIAGRLRTEASSAEPAVRGQIQTQAMNVGLAMQHLGAFLLELGRTILMLRMGQSPAESIVNSGPAVYISASGPSPMMVQPALHTSPLFGFLPYSTIASAGVPGQVNIGDALRNVNIHIHPGTPVAAGGPIIGSRTTESSSGEGAGVGAPSGSRNIDGESGRGLAPRTVMAAIPARTSSASGHVMSVIYPVHVRTQETSSTVPVSDQEHGPTIELGSNAQDHQSEHGPVYTDVLPSDNGAQAVTSGSFNVSDGERNVSVLQPGNVMVHKGNECSSSEHGLVTGNNLAQSGKESSTVGSGLTVDTTAQATVRNQSNVPVEDGKPVPLGLGFGGLKPKRRSKQPKSRGKEEITQGLAGGHNKSIAMGQQVLKSLISHADSRSTIGSSPSTSDPPASLGRNQSAHGECQENGDALQGLSTGQGGFDISRMFQQMMPVLSQALGGSSSTHSLGIEVDRHLQSGDTSACNDKKSYQIDIRPVIDRIQQGDSSVNIFRAMLESARQLCGGEDSEDLVEILGGNEELANEFFEMLRRDAHQLRRRS